MHAGDKVPLLATLEVLWHRSRTWDEAASKQELTRLWDCHAIRACRCRRGPAGGPWWRGRRRRTLGAGWQRVSPPGRTHRLRTGLQAVAVHVRTLGGQVVRRLAEVAGPVPRFAASSASAAATHVAMPVLLPVAAVWLPVSPLPAPVLGGLAASAALALPGRGRPALVLPLAPSAATAAVTVRPTVRSARRVVVCLSGEREENESARTYVQQTDREPNRNTECQVLHIQVPQGTAALQQHRTCAYPPQRPPNPPFTI